MANGKHIHKEADKKEVVQHKGPAVSAALAGKMKGDAGKGVSTAQEDNLVPLIYVLQSGSPQVKKGDPSRIDGAEAGDFWLRNAGEPIIKGETGILFQPCYFTKDWVEWQPNRGGFVGRHAKLPDDAERQEDPRNPNKVSYVRENGNEIVETRYHVGYVLTENGGGAQPFILPLTSTGHAVSRQWMFMMNSKQLDDGTKIPSWGCLYRLKTKVRTNTMGSWFALTVEDAGYIDSETDYDRGAALYQAFSSGAKKAEAPVGAEGGAEKDEVPF